MFDPQLFSHGRVLQRFPGSEAYRFSPHKAERMLAHITRRFHGQRPVLWDPCCGTGLIPAIAALFYRHHFSAIHVSDCNPEAVQCAKQNLQICTNRQAFTERWQEVSARSRGPGKYGRGWSAVAQYMRSLLTIIPEDQTTRPSLDDHVCSFFHLPSKEMGPVVFIGDLPYGKQCPWQGPKDCGLLVHALLSQRPDCSFWLVARKEQAKTVPDTIGQRSISKFPFSGGRILLCSTEQSAQE